jgi:putative ABC transport system substrate-binding protein
MRPRRRLLIALSILAALRLPLARSQGKVRRIGFLAPLSRSTPSQPDVYYDAFVQGMRDLGYVDGKNLAIEWRFADGKFERLPGLAAELAGIKDLELIVTHSTPAIRALQRATAATPIVFAVAIDPVGSGFAASLARPGGNITGLAVIDVDPTPKRLELLKTIVPALSRVAVLVNPGTPVHPRIVKGVQAAGEQAGVAVMPVDAGTAEQLARAFPAMARQGAQGMIVADDAFFRGQRAQIADLAAKNRIPVIAPWREYAAAGGLLSYGQDIAESFRRAATYADRILRGARPGDLPIEQPTRIHLAVNSKTAKALGLVIPRDLLLRADEVID